MRIVPGLLPFAAACTVLPCSTAFLFGTTAIPSHVSAGCQEDQILRQPTSKNYKHACIPTTTVTLKKSNIDDSENFKDDLMLRKQRNPLGWDMKRAMKTFGLSLALMMLAPLSHGGTASATVAENLPTLITTSATVTLVDKTTTISILTTESITTTPATLEEVKSYAYPGMPRTASIMDLAGVIPPASANRILQTMERIQRATGSELQIVVVDRLGTSSTSSSSSKAVLSPKQMATKLFNKWRLGSAKKNNGVLILAVLEDRRIEIEVGRGLNNYMDAPWCTNLLQQTAVPNFRNDNYGKGLEATVDGIAKRLEEVYGGGGGGVPAPSSLPTSLDLSGVIFFGFFAVAIVASAEESMYPKREPCPQCGASYRTWDYSVDGGSWNTTVEATDKNSGLTETSVVCKECGYEDVARKVIRQYDGCTTDSTGYTTYYYNSDSSSDSGGGDSDGGGGGSDW